MSVFFPLWLGPHTAIITAQGHGDDVCFALECELSAYTLNDLYFLLVSSEQVSYSYKGRSASTRFTQHKQAVFISLYIQSDHQN